jgi:F-type H+-transporting ATPase subunit b
MQIDWFTLIAQIVNFVILVILLKYLLYDRITRAMDEREESIGARFSEAEEKKQKAEDEAESYLRKKKELEEVKGQVLSRAKKDADQQRKKFIEKAREEVDESRARWYSAIQRQKVSFLSELRERAGEQVYKVVRRALKDLADNDLEKKMIDTFIRRIEKVRQNEHSTIEDLAGGVLREINVHTSFEIDHQLKKRLASTLRDYGDDRIQINFHKSSDLVCGIELRAGGKRITWSLNSYIDGLEEKMSEELNRRIESNLTGE